MWIHVTLHLPLLQGLTLLLPQHAIACCGTLTDWNIETFCFDLRQFDMNPDQSGSTTACQSQDTWDCHSYPHVAEAKQNIMFFSGSRPTLKFQCNFQTFFSHWQKKSLYNAPHIIFLTRNKKIKHYRHPKVLKVGKDPEPPQQNNNLLCLIEFLRQFCCAKTMCAMFDVSWYYTPWDDSVIDIKDIPWCGYYTLVQM